jgi:hypothetical protein
MDFIEQGRIVIDQSGGRQLFEYSFAAVLGFTAIGRLYDLAAKIIDEQTPQARNMGVTSRMVRRVDFALFMFFAFSLYAAVSPVMRLQGEYDVGILLDLVIHAVLASMVILPLFMNAGELIERGTFTFSRMAYQFRLLSRRGVNFTSMLTACIATGSKFELQGLPVAKTLLAAIM